jgi:hypothetical protein
LRFTEHAEGDVLVISLSTGKLGEEPAVRLDSRTGAAVSAEKDFRATLTRANELLNDVFFKLIPDPELSRFGAKGA